MSLSPNQRSAMLARINAIEADLRQLIDTVQSGAERLSADLELLRASVEEQSTQVAGPAAVPPSAPAAAADDADDARLVALNLALDGTSREAADRYLAEHFQVADRAALLDEVYASVNG